MHGTVEKNDANGKLFPKDDVFGAPSLTLDVMHGCMSIGAAIGMSKHTLITRMPTHGNASHATPSASFSHDFAYLHVQSWLHHC